MPDETSSDTHPRYPEAAEDTTTIKKIWPKLNAEQKQWIKELSPEERETAEYLLWYYGEAYFLQCFEGLKEELEYVRNL